MHIMEKTEQKAEDMGIKGVSKRDYSRHYQVPVIYELHSVSFPHFVTGQFPHM